MSAEQKRKVGRPSALENLLASAAGHAAWALRSQNLGLTLLARRNQNPLPQQARIGVENHIVQGKLVRDQSSSASAVHALDD